METKPENVGFDADMVRKLVSENARLRKLLERALNESARVHPDFANDIRAALGGKTDNRSK